MFSSPTELITLTQEVLKSRSLTLIEANNYLTCLLEVGKLDAVYDLIISGSLPEDSDSSDHWLTYGFLELTRGNLNGASDNFLRADKCGYVGSDMGIRAPGYLYLCAIETNDSSAKKKTLSKLKKYWRKKNLVWPSVIAGFLLDEISDNAFIQTAESSEPLRVRNLCQAYFWLGVNALKTQDKTSSLNWFRKSCEMGGNSILELERYFSRWMSEKLAAKDKS